MSGLGIASVVRDAHSLRDYINAVSVSRRLRIGRCSPPFPRRLKRIRVECHTLGPLASRESRLGERLATITKSTVLPSHLGTNRVFVFSASEKKNGEGRGFRQDDENDEVKGERKGHARPRARIR